MSRKPLYPGDKTVVKPMSIPKGFITAVESYMGRTKTFSFSKAVVDLAMMSLNRLNGEIVKEPEFIPDGGTVDIPPVPSTTRAPKVHKRPVGTVESPVLYDSRMADASLTWDEESALFDDPTIKLFGGPGRPGKLHITREQAMDRHFLTVKITEETVNDYDMRVFFLRYMLTCSPDDYTYVVETGMRLWAVLPATRPVLEHHLKWATTSDEYKRTHDNAEHEVLEEIQRRLRSLQNRGWPLG